MKTYTSNPKQVIWGLIIGIIVLVFLAIQDRNQKMTQDKIMNDLVSMPLNEVVELRVYPEMSSLQKNPQKVLKLGQEDRMVIEFFQILPEISLYQPEHDRASIHWGIQVVTQTTRVTIWCYIPVDKPEIVVGQIDSKAGLVMFQSHSLREWYEKYNHRWLTPAAPPPGATATPTPP